MADDHRLWVAPAVFGLTADGAVTTVAHASGTATTGRAQCLRVVLDGVGRPGLESATGLQAWADAPLPLLRWSHLQVSAYDGEAHLLRDGHLVAVVALASAAPAPQWVASTDFPGLIEPGSIGRQPAVAPAQLWARRGTSDPQRPCWHPAPPTGWMNEPHGVFHYRGRHHLFYQRNERGPYWGSITWGHAVSTDLVHWRDLGSALTPWEVENAPEGIWSGSAAFDDRGPVLFFTGGDNRDQPNQRTLAARPTDLADTNLRCWSTSDLLTTLQDAEAGLAALGLRALPNEFRDPFVWADGDAWFQLVGAGVVPIEPAGGVQSGGTALLFRAPAPDGPWEFVRPLLVGDYHRRPDTGIMWELPVLVPVGRGADGQARHALFVTPWWPEPTEHSLLHEWYWIGRWDADRAIFEPEHTEPREIDYGGHFTGVTTSRTEDGRSLLWSIAQDLLGETEHRTRGWAGVTGLPVEVTCVDGDLWVEPAAEMEALRGPLVEAQPLSDLLRLEPSESVEVEVLAQVPQGGRVLIELCPNEEGDPLVQLSLQRTRDRRAELRVDRTDTRWPERDHRGGAVSIRPDGAVRLRVFRDRSLIECYAQGRAITTRWFGSSGMAAPVPENVVGEADAHHIRVRVESGATLARVRAWPLASAPMVSDRFTC